MPRAKKVTTAQEIETIQDALNTPVERTLEDAADYLGVDPFRLQEMLVERLGIEDPMTWLTIPLDQEPLLEEFKRGIQATASTRKLPESEAIDETPEPPIIEDEAPKLAKTKASKLTQKKTDAIAKGREASTKTQKGVADALTILQAQQGIQDASQAGSTYLHAFTATLGKIKGQGLTTIAAQMLQDLNDKSGFSPDEILQDLGIELSEDIQNELMEVITPALGKYQEATQEILETSWLNQQFNLQDELDQLTKSLNSTD